MDVCAQCGHPLGIGRFCTNCGHPVGAEPVPRPAPEPAPARDPAPVGQHRLAAEGRRDRTTGGWVPWVVALVVMLLVAAIGLWRLLATDDAPSASEPAADAAATEQPPRDPRTPQGRATVAPAPRAEPRDLAASTTVRAPRTAAPTQDVSGQQVTYAATNLLDGVADTCWRMPGDGTGATLTFTFDRPTALSEVGLVNGYAKTASSASGTYDWYTGNRRTLRVEWLLDDGTVLAQRLRQTRELQTRALDEEVVTRRVRLRLVEVTPPGTGRASRDYTALSEVRLLGAPAG